MVRGTVNRHWREAEGGGWGGCWKTGGGVDDDGTDAPQPEQNLCALGSGFPH